MTQLSAFVGRARQLAQLDSLLDKAVAGQGQVCIVTGDAGAGKTLLAAEFLRRAEARHATLVAAVAMGDPQTGASDPYLIFREVLALLTGDVEARLAQGAITPVGALRLEKALRTSIDCLLEYGPDLIGLLVPGAGLAVKIAQIGIDTGKRAGLVDKLTKMPATARPDATGGQRIDQGQIFEQYVKVLKALATHAPLLLILDDLQWADNSSIDLLFHMVRRIEQSRICVIGMYRPAEVALGRAGQPHPLARVVTELKRYYGDVIIDLDTVARSDSAAFTDALLDTEPNRFGAAFRRALLERTGGNPLFMVELLREMEAAGDIVRAADGVWEEGADLDWSALPARAEGVIEARIGRLTTDLLEALKLASVQGDAFTAEVVAQIRNLNIRDFVRQLGSELEKRHRLVTAQGQQRVGEQRLSQYQFQNRLFRQYLYAALDPTERAYLHEDVGRALEQLYGERADEAAPRLAWHFEESGVHDKAQHYLQIAGDQSLRQFANLEAIDYYTRALAVTQQDDAARRYALHLGRVKGYYRLGKRDLQLPEILALTATADQMDDDGKRAMAALQLAIYHHGRDDYGAAAAAAQRSLELAQRAGDEAAEIDARLEIANALFRTADYGAAQQQAQQAYTLADAGNDTRRIADSLWNLGGIAIERGHLVEALGYLERAQTLYHEIGESRGESGALEGIARIASRQGDFGRARTMYEFSLDVMRGAGIVASQSATLINLGALLIQLGDLAAAGDVFDQALALSDETGERFFQGAAHVNISVIRRLAAAYAEAYSAAQQALAIFEAINSPYGEMHAMLQIGHALAGLARHADATDAYGRTIAICDEIGNEGLKQEAQAGLARLHLGQGDPIAANDALKPVLDHLDAGNDLAMCEEPLWIYLTCYEVLTAIGDSRAPALLAEGYRQLQDKVAQLPDERARLRCLNNIPHHRALVFAATGDYPPPVPVASSAPPIEALPQQAAAVALAPQPVEPLVEPPPALAPPPPTVQPSALEQRPLPGGWRQRVPRLFWVPGVLGGLAALLVLVWLAVGNSVSGCPPACAGRRLNGRDWRAETLTGVDLSGSDLRAAQLAAADLTAATLISATLGGADLHEANLTAALANGMVAVGARLDGALLRGADLQAADLRGASLVGADLTSADLRGARLVGADLRGALLNGSDLRGSDLRAALLTGSTAGERVDLTGARFDETTRWPYGFVPDAP